MCVFGSFAIGKKYICEAEGVDGHCMDILEYLLIPPYYFAITQIPQSKHTELVCFATQEVYVQYVGVRVCLCNLARTSHVMKTATVIQDFWRQK